MSEASHDGVLLIPFHCLIALILRAKTKGNTVQTVENT